MSRVLISTLALSVFGGSAVLAQPLNINPYPKAATLSSQGPEIRKPEPAEVFADEAEEEILRLERENEALAKELEEQDAKKREQEAKEAEVRAREEANLKRLEQERRTAQLQKEKEELAQKLAAEEEQRRAAQLEQERKANELAALEAARQREIDDEVAALERENAALADKLAVMQAEPIELEKPEPLPVRESQEQIDLRAENKRLAAELREQTEVKRKQAELDLAMRALEAQKKADMAAVVPVEVEAPAVDPLFESAVMADAGVNNPVKMTPMPIKSQPLVQDEVLEVRASDLGLVEPAAETPKVAIQPQAIVSAPAKTTIQVLPMPAERQSASDFVATRSLYRTAKPGESLEDVLRSWSQAEGVGFLWKTTQRYDVSKPVANDGNYAASVGALLEQYGDQSVRPIGKLHTDPVTGFTTLSVFSE